LPPQKQPQARDHLSPKFFNKQQSTTGDDANNQ
jgi:hypothetical protein